MSKLRRLMNRLSHGALTSVAALALTVTATNMNRCCWFIFGQDKMALLLQETFWLLEYLAL